MKDMKMIKDKRLVLLEAIIRYADQSDNFDPHFYKDDMLKRLDVCEHVFNIMQKQLGDRYCRMVDSFEKRSKYTINVLECLELRDQIIQANTQEKKHRESRIILLETLIATFFVILIGSYIM